MAARAVNSTYVPPNVRAAIDAATNDEKMIAAIAMLAAWDGVLVAQTQKWATAAAFDESKYARNPRGERDGVESPSDGGKFRSKGGYHSGTDRVGSPEFNDLNRSFTDSPVDFFPENGSPDGALVEIVRLQGYDGLPEVVSVDELEARLPQHDDEGYRINEGDGSIGLWRGLSGDNVGEKMEQFRSGSLYLGEGLYGNGIYATPVKAFAKAYTNDIASKQPKGLMRLALKPGVKVVDLEDSDFQRNWKNAAYNSYEPFQPRPLYLDAGRYAASRGYDALRTPDGNYVIFNRTAVVVAR